MNTKNLTVFALLISLIVLPSCATNPNRSPGGTVFGSTVGGAGLGSLIGWAAGDAGLGAAIGAGVGLIAGAIQADEDARVRDEIYRPIEEEVIIRRRVPRVEHSEFAGRETRARDYLARAQRTSDISLSIQLLKRSLKEYRTPEAHTALGDIFRGQGNDPRAINEYGRALDLDPDYRPAYEKLDQLQN